MELLCFSALLFLVLGNQLVSGQVDIEVYDLEVFHKKINSSIYDIHAYPRHEHPEPVSVNVSIQLERFGPNDEAKSEFTASLQIYFRWIDERLAVNSTPNQTIRHFEADQIHLLQIWRPSVFFSNANSLTPDLLSDQSPGQIMGKIGANGKVQIVKRTSITSVCKVNIKLYPVDMLECDIELQSKRQLRLQWDTLKPILFSSDLHWGVFELVSFNKSVSRTSYDLVGPFSKLEVNFILRRKLGHFLLDVYLPSALFVISSWASFWIDIPAAPARVALVLTTMLTHVTNTKTIHDKHPRVSYFHSLDVWVMVCTMFIFAALIEYATANYFYHKRDRMKDKKLDSLTESKPSLRPHFEEDSLRSFKPPPVMSIFSSDENNNDPSARNFEEEKTHRAYSHTFTAGTKPPISADFMKCPQDVESPTLLKRAWKSMLSVIVPPFENNLETRRTALEIDRKSRFVFPFAFFVFNVIYWSILIVFSLSNQP